MDMSDWTIEDMRAAWLEGWDIFDCDGSDNGRWQLSKIDDPPLWREERGPVEREWDDDTDVWLLVLNTPSDLHTKALAIIQNMNPQEYESIMKWAVGHKS